MKFVEIPPNQDDYELAHRRAVGKFVAVDIITLVYAFGQRRVQTWVTAIDQPLSLWGFSMIPEARTYAHATAVAVVDELTAAAEALGDDAARGDVQEAVKRVMTARGWDGADLRARLDQIGPKRGP